MEIHYIDGTKKRLEGRVDWWWVQWVHEIFFDWWKWKWHDCEMNLWLCLFEIFVCGSIWFVKLPVLLMIKILKGTYTISLHHNTVHITLTILQLALLNLNTNLNFGVDFYRGVCVRDWGSKEGLNLFKAQPINMAIFYMLKGWKCWSWPVINTIISSSAW